MRFKRFRDASIYQKVSLVGFFSVLFALSTYVAFFSIYETRRTVNESRASVKALADLISSEVVAALEFEDLRTARNILNGLKLNSSVVAAAVYKADKGLFVSYRSSLFNERQFEIPAVVEPEGITYKDSNLLLVQDIVFKGRSLGFTLIALDNEVITNKLNRHLRISILASIVPLLGGVLVALVVAHFIALPIRRMSQRIEEIRLTGNFSDRLDRERGVEVANLAKHFNLLLAQIEEWGQELNLEIEQRKEIEKNLRSYSLRLESMTKELKHSNEELEQFTHIAAHDLKEPVKILSNYCDLLEMEIEDASEDAQQYIRTIRNASIRMLNLIDDFYNLSTIGKESFEMERHSLSELAHKALADLSSLLEEKGIEVQVAELPEVDVSPLLLQQIFKNLIQNALKYAEGPDVSVRIDCTEDTSEYIIEVFNSGSFVPPDRCEAIFLPLKRLHSKKYTGTGMGLTICKKIVERHGGRIWVESEKGRGTTFKFTLKKQGKGGERVVHADY